MREAFPACCACTEEHGARSMEHRAKTMAQIEPRNCGLRISDCGFWERVTKTLIFIFAFSISKSEIPNSKLLHRITLSARTSTFGGIVSPICLAAFRLMISSNLIGRSTGRSAGLTPFKILST
jgi:hypothetical protein